MKQELDELLCKKYPKLFVNRNKPMQETCMCWGFSCGDGWYNIINNLCGNIQHHIDWKRKQRAHALQYNRCLKRAVKGDKAGLTWYYTYENGPTEYTYTSVDRDIEDGRFRNVPDAVSQVTVDQVKEKFGTLRFYHTGGDDYIRGMITMAEAMSGSTCESCGNPGKQTGGGWIRTICEPCEIKREQERDQFYKTAIKTDIL